MSNPVDLILTSANFQIAADEYEAMIVARNKRDTRNHTDRMIRWQKSHPLQRQAQSAVAYAVKTGRLTRGPCIVNDEHCHGRIEFHHWHGYDEDHWLDVVSICKYHHELADTKDE